MQNVTDEKTLTRWRESAERYARAERSDPFALQRAITHIRTGVVSYAEREDPKHGKIIVEGLYNADPVTEFRRLHDGTEYAAVVYRNMRRP